MTTMFFLRWRKKEEAIKFVIAFPLQFITYFVSLLSPIAPTKECGVLTASVKDSIVY